MGTEKIDTSGTVEIRKSPLSLLIRLAGSLLMMLMAAALAFHWIPVQPGSFKEFVGYVGLVLSPTIAGIILWYLLTLRGPVITISPEGIRDTRVAAEFIRWDAIKNISTWQYRNVKVMLLTIDPAVENALTLTTIARWSRAPNYAMGADGLCIAPAGLKTNYHKLFSTTLAYAQAARHVDSTPASS